jgi:rRNA biogenesis protein RRP5
LLFIVAQISEATNVSSILPGALLKCTITEVHQSGLNVKALGSFDSTIDWVHQGRKEGYKVGHTLKARVLYSIPGSPSRFALTALDRIIRLSSVTSDEDEETLQNRFPLGDKISEATVLRIEPDHGVFVGVDGDAMGLIHVII